MALSLSDVNIANAVTSVDTTGTEKVITLPETGVSVGDMMCVALSYNISSTDAGDEITIADWNQAITVALPATTSTPRLYFYWREVPGGGLGASATFTSVTSSFNSLMGVAFSVTNANVTALDQEPPASATGTSTSLDCPADTAASTGGIVVRVGVTDDDDDAAAQPSLDTHTAVEYITNGTTNGASLFVWVEVQEGTSVGSASATLTSTEEWAAVTAIIKEAGAASSIIPQGTGRGILRGIGRGIS